MLEQCSLAELIGQEAEAWVEAWVGSRIWREAMEAEAGVGSRSK